MNHSASIRVSSQALTPVVDEQVYSALLDEIAGGIGTNIQSTYVEYEPPAAGMSEIAATISFLADSKEVILPIVTWMAGQFGGPAFKKLRDHLDGARRSKESGRPYIPLCVVFGTNRDNPGSVRFYFHGRPTEAQLKRQFEAMYRVIDALPEMALAERAGPPEYGFFWDEKQSRWRGMLFYSADPDAYEEVWFPDDVFDRVPGWNAPSEPE